MGPLIVGNLRLRTSERYLTVEHMFATLAVRKTASAPTGSLVGRLSMGVLREAIERISIEDADSWSSETLADAVVELRQELDLLEVHWTRWVALLTEKDGLEGHSSATAFLKDRCRMSAARAQRSVILAGRLPELPFVGKAVEAGGLSLDQARVFSDLSERLSDDLTRDEVTLVNTVGALSVANTKRALDYWKAAVDGPGTAKTADDLFDRRYLFGSKTWDGMIKLDGLLDPAAGDLVMTALQAATPPRRDGDLRSPRQRRADALTDLARTFLDSGHAAGSEKPHLLVLTDLDALQGHGGGIHETSNGQVLTPNQVRETACDAVVNRIVFGPDSQPVDIGRTTRVIPPSMRRALIARDRHCRHPGCDRPSQWTDAHHIWHWADGGPTALSNLKLLCRYHHTLQHQKAESQGP
jgi:hypothetical protein